MKFHKDGSRPMSGTTVFVFGSNLAGRHGSGAARAARENYGAEYGKGVGRTNQAYAIPTLNGDLKKLSLSAISVHVSNFLAYTLLHPELEFFVTRIGCVLAGYSNSEIAPMFKAFPDNCSFAEEWKPFLEEVKV